MDLLSDLKWCLTLPVMFWDGSITVIWKKSCTRCSFLSQVTSFAPISYAFPGCLKMFVVSHATCLGILYSRRIGLADWPLFFCGPSDFHGLGGTRSRRAVPAGICTGGYAADALTTIEGGSSSRDCTASSAQSQCFFGLMFLSNFVCEFAISSSTTPQQQLLLFFLSCFLSPVSDFSWSFSCS